MRISHIWLGLGEQRGPEQPPTVGAAAFIYAERCVCVNIFTQEVCLPFMCIQVHCGKAG